MYLKKKSNRSSLHIQNKWKVFSVGTVIYPPTTVPGILGSFITRYCAPYKMYKHYRNNVLAHCLLTLAQYTAVNPYMEDIPVNAMMVPAVTENSKNMASIISAIMFYGTQLALDQNKINISYFKDLFQPRIWVLKILNLKQKMLHICLFIFRMNSLLLGRGY